MPQRLPDRFHVGLLITAAFCMDLVIRAASQAYQETGLSFSAEPFQLGLLGTIGAFCYSVCCLFSGTISDRIGRRTSTYAALAGICITYYAAGRVTRIEPLLLLPIIGGSSLAFFWPAAQAWLADLSGVSPRRLARRMSIFNCFWSAGLMVGPVYTGFLWAYGLERGRSSQNLVFTSLIGLALIIVALLTFLRKRATDAPDDTPPTKPEPSPSPHAKSLLFGGRAGTFAAWFAVGVVGSLFPKLGADLGYDERMRGLVVAAYHAGQSGMFFLAFFTIRWAYRRWPLALAEGLAVVGMVSVVWASSPWHFALAFWLAGLTSGLAYSVSLFHSLHGRTGDRGKLAGTHEAILACGVFLGPLTGGLLAQHISLRAPYVMVAGVLLVTLAVQFVVWRRSRRHPQPVPPPEGEVPLPPMSEG